MGAPLKFDLSGQNRKVVARHQKTLRYSDIILGLPRLLSSPCSSQSMKLAEVWGMQLHTASCSWCKDSVGKFFMTKSLVHQGEQEQCFPKLVSIYTLVKKTGIEPGSLILTIPQC